MKASGNKKETLKAWADVVIKMWESKILLMDVYDTGYLYNSFISHVLANSGGDVSKIDFIFGMYGVYADMGVGRETARGNSGDVGKSATVFDETYQSHRLKRQPRKWYSTVFFREVMKLRFFLEYEYGRQAAIALSEGMSVNFDQRYKFKEKTVNSLRTVRYRGKQAARNKLKSDRRKEAKAFGYDSWAEWAKTRGDL